MFTLKRNYDQNNDAILQLKSMKIDKSNKIKAYDIENDNKIYGKQIKNQQQKSGKIQRYLKEYQYNAYQSENKQRKCLHDLNLNQNQIKNHNDEIQYKIKSKTRPSYENFFPQSRYSLNYSASNDSITKSNLTNLEIKSQLKNVYGKQNNFQNKENKKKNYDSIFLYAKTNSSLKKQQQHIEKEPIFSSETQKYRLISKQEIVLLKHLREQNNELKSQISKQKLYIEQLESKLEKYLQQTILKEKQTDNFCQHLQKKLENAQNEIIKLKIEMKDCKQSQSEKLQAEINSYKQKQKQYEDIFQKIFKRINIPQSQSISNFQQSKILHFFQEILNQKNTVDNFISKVEEMKNKIESKHYQNQQILIVKNNSGNSKKQKINQKKPVNLKQLWKWLKKIGKQYEVIKQKLSSIQKDQSLSKN